MSFSSSSLDSIQLGVDSLELVDLEQSIEGFRQFISCWIYSCDKGLVLIDPGPASSLPILMQALGGREPDLILLTHIHVDHAGGIGQLVAKFPHARVFSAPRAHRHLVDPRQLIEGSWNTLGDLMKEYGEIVAIPTESICEEAFVKEILPDFTWIESPGHASHHISFLFKNLLFCGEALGVVCPLADGFYLRPATPPKFFPDIYKASINRLKSICDSRVLKSGEGFRLCFGHFGLSSCLPDWQFGFDWEGPKGESPLGKSIFDIADFQIETWISVIGKLLTEDCKYLGRSEVFRDKAIEILLEQDPCFAGFQRLPSDVQSRESRFVGNSIKGILDFLSREKAS